MPTLPTPFPRLFRQVHVVSDLHLGGPTGAQIFREGKALAAYIGRIDPEAKAEVCFVINGDFVDFLAEAPARHFDPEGAVRKLEQIASNEAFSPVFEALQKFVAQPGHWLGIVLGNHDIELALPWVRERLLEMLAPEPQARGRCLLSLQDEGLLLQVGGGSPPFTAAVMCVHGNEVDGWNVVDHEELRRRGRDAQRGQDIEDWIPNAGSRLVIEVMNEIKGSEFAFVDVLKPETEAVLPILFALKPSVLARLNTIGAAAARQAVDRTRIRWGWLGDEEQRPADDTRASAEAARAPTVRAARPLMPAVAAHMADELLDRTEERLANEQDPLELIDADRQREYLGYIGAGWNLLKRDPVEALRQALEGLDKDRSFDLLHRDATFRDLHERVSTNIDFLVAGHTHLARAIEREGQRAFYYNTGTWARVFRIDEKTRRDRAKFASLFSALRTRDLGKLDKLPGLVRVPPCVAVIAAEKGAVAGQLFSVDGDVVAPIEHTRFVRR